MRLPLATSPAERALTSMMADQAEGLRRLLGRDRLRIITMVSGGVGVGKTSATINLAVALARGGRKVLVLDENCGAAGVTGALGLAPRHDLWHVLRREKTLEQVIVPGPGNIAVLAAAHSAQRLAELGQSERQWLADCFSGPTAPGGVVVVDAAAGGAGSVLPLNLAAQEVVVVLSAAAPAITEAYALIKMLSQNQARRHFRILVNKAKGGEAHTIFNNMAQAARRYLAVSLDLLGFVPPDEKLRSATRLCQPVVEVFPDAAAADCFCCMAGAVAQWPNQAEEGAAPGHFMQCRRGGRASSARVML